MASPAQLPDVSPDPTAVEDSATAAQLSATVPLKQRWVADASSLFPELRSDPDFDAVTQARAHADAVVRLQVETETLRHIEAILATDQLAAVERKTQEIAELNAKAEQRVQSLSTARVEDARLLHREINSRAIAEARSRVVLRRRFAEEQRLHQAARIHAEVEAEATRLSLQRGDAEAAAAKRESERLEAEKNATVLAQQHLALVAEAAAIAETDAVAEREALDSAQRRVAAEERRRDMQAKRAELEQRAAQQALRRAKLEAELAVEAKRRADADMSASESVAARIEAERETADIAQQQATAEAALALASSALRDARRSEVKAIIRRTEAAAERAIAANQEQWATNEELAGEYEYSRAGDARTGESTQIPTAANAEPAALPARRFTFRWSMAAVGAVALVIALVLPQPYRQQVTGEIVDRIGFGQDRAVVSAFPAQPESGLQGLKMTDQLSRPPNTAR